MVIVIRFETDQVIELEIFKDSDLEEMDSAILEREIKIWKGIFY